MLGGERGSEIPLEARANRLGNRVTTRANSQSANGEKTSGRSHAFGFVVKLFFASA